MAIQITYTDTYGATHTECYVKIREIVQQYDTTPAGTTMLAFYHNSTTRSDTNLKPFHVQSFFIADVDASIDVTTFTDMRNAYYKWLMNNESIFSAGIEV